MIQHAPSLLDWDMFYATKEGARTLNRVEKRIAALWQRNTLREANVLAVCTQEHVATHLHAEWCLPNWFSATGTQALSPSLWLEDSLPVRHQSQDIVVLMDTLEWHAEPMLLLEEIWKSLRPNGEFLLFLPGRYSIYSPHDVSSEKAHQAIRAFQKHTPEVACKQHRVYGVSAHWYEHLGRFMESFYCRKIQPNMTPTKASLAERLLPLQGEVKGSNCMDS